MINTTEQAVLESTNDAFEGENRQTGYSVLGYRNDLYFHKHKLAIEVNELGHADKNFSYGIERQKVLETKIDCVFLRINSDEENFNTFKEIKKINRHIKIDRKKIAIIRICNKSLNKIQVFKIDC